MIKTHLLLLFFCHITLYLLSSCSNPKSSQNNKSTPEDTLVKIPNEWIEKLKNPQTSKQELIQGFFGFLYPKEADPSPKAVTYSFPYVKFIFHNVDDSPEEELFLWIGLKALPWFTIIKKIDQQWYLLYANHLGGVCVPGKLKVHQSDALRKLFYVEAFHSQMPGTSGSGISGCGKKVFFRIINNRVKKVLSVVDQYDATTRHPNLALVDHRVQSNVDKLSLDTICVRYSYEFLPGLLLAGLTTLEPAPYPPKSLDLPLLQQQMVCYYPWNSSTQRYELNNGQQRPKIAALSSTDASTVFYQTFQSTIDSLATQGNGRPYTQAIVQHLLKRRQDLPSQALPSPCGQSYFEYYQSRNQQ